ncbi:hypothetical protein Zmor_026282 [Zophobas morio]|uniref:Hydrocephalus-inducing protein n=1 Tax=Zophobas morio TaxID=2755281 RepID=A0AA38M4Y0_9CUCU|nr:hypothetical protein Zmor_026282 [Zophobas morio]
MSYEEPQSYVNCIINFGVVPVGTTVIKKYPLKNKHYDAVTFYVTRSTNTNPIYYVFDVNKYETKVPAGGTFMLKISYTPNISGSIDYDYFTITNTQHHFYKLCFNGESTGPSVKVSIRSLIFFQTPKRIQSKQMFTLTNPSKVPAIFQFDVGEEEQGVFTVEPILGTLGPEGQALITVRFLPQAHRLYSRQLCCLVLYHHPLIIHLFGICSLSDEYDNPELAFRYYPFPHEETVGFKGYFSDSVTMKHVPPPISLTVNYLDFGRILPDSSCQTLTTSFTNHMDNEVAVEWEEINLFRLYPEKLEIPPKKSALYECRFQPDDTCRLSGAILNGHVTWSLFFDSDFPESINVPIPITLRVIGHSFPKNQIWIPSISITPNNVILPLNLPNFPSWTTFIIRAHGHLPVLYKLVPPSKTLVIYNFNQ